MRIRKRTALIAVLFHPLPAHAQAQGSSDSAAPTIAEDQPRPLAETPAQEQPAPYPSAAPAPGAPPPPVPGPSRPAPASPRCPCIRGPTEYRHDGYYQRLSIGLGYTSFWGTGPAGSASISGIGSSFALAFGGTPWDGVVIAGTLGGAAADGAFKGSSPAASGDASALLPLIGVLTDWYPIATGPWHAGAAFGFSGFSTTDSNGRNSTGLAPGGSLFGGHDSWIGPQYSIGIAAILFIAGPSSGTDSRGYSTDYRFMAASFGLQTSLLWH